jgi:hypothetical protein
MTARPVMHPQFVMADIAARTLPTLQREVRPAALQETHHGH